MTSEELNRIKAVLEQHAEWGRRRVMDATGLPEKTVRTALQHIKGNAPKELQANKASSVADTKAVLISEIVAANDTVGRIVSIVDAIPGGSVKHDEDVRKEIGLGNDRWRRARGSARLAGHFAQLPDKSLVWGRKNTIQALIERLKELV